MLCGQPKTLALSGKTMISVLVNLPQAAIQLGEGELAEGKM